jgi:hypothetical protein
MVMKQTIAIFVMMATMILFGSSVAYAGCNNLTVELNSNEWNIDSNNISCTHGHVEYSGNKFVIMTNTGYYGPDCRIGFLNSTTEKSAVVELQQNYCAMEAGGRFKGQAGSAVFRSSAFLPKYVVNQNWLLQIPLAPVWHRDAHKNMRFVYRTGNGVKPTVDPCC